MLLWYFLRSLSDCDDVCRAVVFNYRGRGGASLKVIHSWFIHICYIHSSSVMIHFIGRMFLLCIRHILTQLVYTRILIIFTLSEKGICYFCVNSWYAFCHLRWLCAIVGASKWPNIKIWDNKIFIELQPFKIEMMQDNYTTRLDTLTKYQTTPIILHSLSLRKLKTQTHSNSNTNSTRPNQSDVKLLWYTICDEISSITFA